jgi:hypothetical protein
MSALISPLKFLYCMLSLVELLNSKQLIGTRSAASKRQKIFYFQVFYCIIA